MDVNATKSILASLREGITSQSESQTQNIAARLARELKPQTTLALNGSLGSGKTSFTQGLGRGFGIKEHIKSPTFNLINFYQADNQNLIHIDAYRLQASANIDYLMLEDYLQTPWCLVVEWPENFQNAWTKNALNLHFKITPSQERFIRIET